MHEVYDFLFIQLNIISNFGNSFYAVLLSFLLVLFLIAKDKNIYRLISLLLVVLSYPYSLTLKMFFKLPRPNELENIWLSSADKYSFPSTHVIFYTVFWGFVFYLTYKLSHLEKLTRHTIRALSVLFIISIGASRIALGAHYFRDVFAGYALGVIYLIAVLSTDKIMHKILSKYQKHNN